MVPLVKLWASSVPVRSGRQQNLLGSCLSVLCIKSPVLASVLNAKSKVLFNFQATLDVLGKLGFMHAAVWVLILQKHHKATPWISNRASLSSDSLGKMMTHS